MFILNKRLSTNFWVRFKGLYKVPIPSYFSTFTLSISKCLFCLSTPDVMHIWLVQSSYSFVLFYIYIKYFKVFMLSLNTCNTFATFQVPFRDTLQQQGKLNEDKNIYH